MPGSNRAARFPSGRLVSWPDSVWDSECFLYDPTSQSGRDFLFSMLETGYIRDGIRNFWFDASEPENIANYVRTDSSGKEIHYNNPLGQPQGTTFSGGTNQQIGMLYPFYHSQMVTEGLTALYPNETSLTLSRSGWAGQQRFGVVEQLGHVMSLVRFTVSFSCGGFSLA